ncbi:MAG: efflux RND transporter periplasmic adaptor subunit [Nitrospirae bacterium]|nr:efflux RND transporter periplasmic adaptor subunit [Nitrospirota bacterium]
MRTAIWIASVLAVGLAIGGYVFFSGERKVPIRYRTAPLELGPVVSMVAATGTINPVVSVQVGSQVSGMIQSLHADFNSIVKAGEVVARIDSSPFKARRDQAAANLEIAKANVAKARTDLAQRKRELDRLKSLMEQQFVSQNDVDVAVTAHQGAQAQLEVADAQVKQAEATLSSADLDLKYTVIRSPVNGIVIARNVEVGQTVAASFATPNLFLIALDLTQMQVDTNVSESDIGGIAEGKEASFTVDAYPGERFRGQVRQVRNAPISVQNVVTYNVVIGVDNRDMRLKPGMTANVSIIVARKDQVVKAPNAALRFTPPKLALSRTEGSAKPDGPDGRTAASTGGAGADAKAARLAAGGAAGQPLWAKVVWRLGPSGDPEAVSVQTGISDGNFTEVVGGEMKEGDEVIIGIDVPRGGRKQDALPPGFGSGQRRPSSRDRGL